MTREQKILQKIRDEHIAVICSSRDEAKQLFNLDFPYEVKDLSDKEPFEGDYSKQGFYFSEFPNSYDKCYLFELHGYKTVPFSDLLVEIGYYQEEPKTIEKFEVIETNGRIITLCLLIKHLRHREMNEESLKQVNEKVEVNIGYSVCHPNDGFNPELGEKIAKGRAGKNPIITLDVPTMMITNNILDNLLSTAGIVVYLHPEVYIKGIQ